MLIFPVNAINWNSICDFLLNLNCFHEICISEHDMSRFGEYGELIDRWRLQMATNGKFEYFLLLLAAFVIIQSVFVT